MNKLDKMQPERVLYYFEQITKIPRGSQNRGPIGDYLMDFASKHQLKALRDEADNIVIFKDASEGMETSEPMILQSHTDMVCDKDNGFEFDFETQPIEILVEDNKITANHTTLGADNGMGMAYGLAILESETIVHPPLEVLFTSDEEIGMVGAGAFDASVLTGKRILNIDSENEKYVTVGCAGGVRCDGEIPVTFIDVQDKGGLYIRIAGLKGGHSGEAIDKGRANANKLMGRLLFDISKEYCFSIVSLRGGTKDNAIPWEAESLITVEKKDVAACREFVKAFESRMKIELGSREPDFHILAEERQIESERMLSPNAKGLVLFLLMNFPNGVQEMSYDVKGMVETSCNLGVMGLEGDKFVVQTLIRSSIETAKEALRDKTAYLIEFLGGECYVSQNYPAWSYKADSKMRDLYIKAFEKIKGEKPIVEVIHAGLECGILSDKIPNADCISIGPDLFDIHTTKEAADIESINSIWNIILEVLRCA